MEKEMKNKFPWARDEQATFTMEGGDKVFGKIQWANDTFVEILKPNENGMDYDVLLSIDKIVMAERGDFTKKPKSPRVG